jgi:hypothetical protein
LEGLEDDPDFWNMHVDEHGDEIPEPQVVRDLVVRDLTKPRGSPNFNYKDRKLILDSYS